jgi:IclR family pca regulon transcriptional regulator
VSPPNDKGKPARQADPLFNRATEKALSILEAFAGQQYGLSSRELAVCAGVSTRSAGRSARTLERIGYLRRCIDKDTWALTPRALRSAAAYLCGHALIERSTRHLIDLELASGESISLAEPCGTEMVRVARFPGHRTASHRPLGQQLPMFCTASGRAYLAGLPREQARAILSRCSFRRYTDRTLVDPKLILEQIDAARQAGYAWEDQEYVSGEVTIAAPVTAATGSSVATVDICTHTGRWSIEELRAKLSVALIESALACSRPAEETSRRRLLTNRF